MKLKTLVSPIFQAAFSALYNEQKLPTQTKFKLRTLSRKIQEFAKDFEEQRMDIVKKHAEKAEDGSMVFADDSKTQIKLADVPGFNAEMSALLEVEVELKSLAAEELGSELSLSAAQLEALGELVLDSAS